MSGCWSEHGDCIVTAREDVVTGVRVRFEVISCKCRLG